MTAKKPKQPLKTLLIPVEVTEEEYNILSEAAKDRKTTPEAIYKSIIDECEALDTDEFYDTMYEALAAYYPEAED